MADSVLYGKLVSGKKSERQEKNPQASMTQEEFDKKKTEQAEKRKARKNNGAKRDMHYEMKEVHVTIDPVMDADFEYLTKEKGAQLIESHPFSYLSLWIVIYLT